jgi:hypothetical protein
MGAMKKGHLYYVQSYSLDSSGAITGDFNVIAQCNESTKKFVKVTFLVADSKVDCADVTQTIKIEESKSWEVLHNRSKEISVKDLPLYIGWPYKTDLFMTLLKGH